MHHPRAIRRHLAAGRLRGPPGRADADRRRAAAASTSGSTLAGPRRRRWGSAPGPPRHERAAAGPAPQAPDELHLRVRVRFADGGHDLRFVDQRTFGGLALVDTDAAGLPLPVAHIARDPLDHSFDDEVFAASLRRRRTGLKRALLDQTLISGIGNIYADEALWRARLH